VRGRGQDGERDRGKEWRASAYQVVTHSNRAIYTSAHYDRLPLNPQLSLDDKDQSIRDKNNKNLITSERWHILSQAPSPALWYQPKAVLGLNFIRS
jgi:hypothetical protein